MSTIGIPFNPLRKALYTAADLYEGLDAADPSSYAACADSQILRYYVRMSSKRRQDPSVSALEALHDTSISNAIRVLLETSPKVVAIMGGHGMARDSAAYAGVARLAHELARDGYLVISGGGPGAMEATHLGALLSKFPKSDLDAAIGSLCAEAVLPKSANLVAADGTVDASIAAQLHRWLMPAMKILDAIPEGQRGMSLGVPTWLYGFEPTTPFATHIGKYFQNSVREDGLVTMGVSGIVYAPGSAGTVQEIFQDAAQNYYGDFAPMVFLSSPGERYWEDQLPVRPLIEKLLGVRERFATRVIFTDSVEEALGFLCV